MTDNVLAFAHLGDLHMTDLGQPNHLDLMAIVAQIETQARRQLDFVALPGDCAENGLPEQYALVETALRMLSLPVHIIPGDHDMEPGDLSNFHDRLQVDPLPYAARLKGKRCLFLDVCSAGEGGPDFRLGEDQLGWVAGKLKQAAAAKEEAVVFMHAYPEDLADEVEAEALMRLFADCGVALVDMGHTHYNELANDGRTIFAATRSTGQIEEGPVGYSLATLDGGVVSWRFKPLADPFPFVMITSPADHRLMRGEGQRVGGRFVIRARVFGAEPLARVECQVNEGAWRPMQPVGDGGDWGAEVEAPEGRLIDVMVRAVGVSGRPGLHAIRAAGSRYEAPAQRGRGSAAAIGPWPENGLSGTRLGPNANGRKW